MFVTDSDILPNMAHPSNGWAPADTMVPCGFYNSSMLCKHLDKTPSGIPTGCALCPICHFTHFQSLAMYQGLLLDNGI